MAAQILNAFPSITRAQIPLLHSNPKQARFSSFSLRSPNLRTIVCSASKPPPVQPKKHSPSQSNRNRNNNTKKNKSDGEFGDSNSTSTSNSSLPHIPTPMPKPPAGFVVDDSGKLLTSSKDRLATLVSSSSSLFRSNFLSKC